MTIYTIGHSVHPIQRLVELLRKHSITALCDVRATPYSRMNPQFNRETLQRSIENAMVAYRWLGAELGARPLSYELVAQLPDFQRGLKRLQRGLEQGYRVAILCAEKEPLECHRTILVSRNLVRLGIAIEHIHADASLESHDRLVDRLLEATNLPGQDLLHSREELIDEAYRRQEARMKGREW